MKNLRITLLLFLLTFKSIAQQKSDTTFSFSIKEAIDFALINQKDVVNASIDVDISKYKVKETVGIGLPQITGNFDVKDYEKLPVSLIPAEFVGGEPGTFAPLQFGTRWTATAGI